jgi:hypothetical protein
MTARALFTMFFDDSSLDAMDKYADTIDAQIAADKAEIERLNLRLNLVVMEWELAAKALATARQEGRDEAFEEAAAYLLDQVGRWLDRGDSNAASLSTAHMDAIRALKTAPTTGGENLRAADIAGRSGSYGVHRVVISGASDA